MTEQRETRYWLMKSEPDVYGIDDLARDGETCWDGVRNYQARNFMRDEMVVGDRVLYYHSRTKPMAVVGIARVVREAYPDHTQFDQDNKYFDPKATPETPRWMMVDLGFESKLTRPVTLAEIKEDEGLDGMLVARRGQRLSIQPVEAKHFFRVLELAGHEG